MNKLQKDFVLIDSPGRMKIPVIHQSVRGKGGDDNGNFTNHKQALMSLNPCHDEMLCTLVEEKVLYRISAKYLEPLKGSIQNNF